jgi:hypothetical protein
VFSGGPPLWHVSGSLRSASDGSPLPIAALTAADRAAVMAQMKAALRGVGDRRQRHEEEGTYALHLRRPCTEAEARALGRTVTP